MVQMKYQHKFIAHFGSGVIHLMVIKCRIIKDQYGLDFLSNVWQYLT